MKNSTFWVMLKKKGLEPEEPSGFLRSHSQIPEICIVELTADELVYIWPYRPSYNSLCLVCKNLNQRGIEVCKANVPIGYPCSFDAVPETEACQDFDDFLIDGEFLAECGYFYSIEDFKRLNGYPDTHYLFYPVGEQPSIRAARQWIFKVANKLSQSL